MRLYTCHQCGNQLYFESTVCAQCGAVLGFLPDTLLLEALTSVDGQCWQPAAGGGQYRKCLHYEQYHVCNWMVPADSSDAFCTACRLNRTIPDLSRQRNLTLWFTLESDKRRLIHSILRLGLPLAPRSVDPAGLAFDFLADDVTGFTDRGRVMTGHDSGLITLNIAEADPVTRERFREEMDEPYRTVLGHFRHESGHYYWDRLIRHTSWLDPFRSLFGDERADYAQALDQHYRNGAPPNWNQSFVSSYAGCHPWEDWAETWAHYLHIVDTLETAHQFGLRLAPRAGRDAGQFTAEALDPYATPQLATIVGHWLPLAFALNSLNRSMGHPPAYPFILTPAVIEKLDFVHRVVRGCTP